MTRTLLGLVSPFRLWPSILSGVVGILLVGERVLGGRPEKQMYPDILTFIQPQTLALQFYQSNFITEKPDVSKYFDIHQPQALVLQFYQSNFITNKN